MMSQALLSWGLSDRIAISGCGSDALVGIVMGAAFLIPVL